MSTNSLLTGIFGASHQVLAHSWSRLRMARQLGSSRTFRCRTVMTSPLWNPSRPTATNRTRWEQTVTTRATSHGPLGQSWSGTSTVCRARAPTRRFRWCGRPGVTLQFWPLCKTILRPSKAIFRLWEKSSCPHNILTIEKHCAHNILIMEKVLMSSVCPMFCRDWRPISTKLTWTILEWWWLGKGIHPSGNPTIKQVAMQTGASTPRVSAIKPKVYLTCTVRLPPKTWGRVTVWDCWWCPVFAKVK